MYELIVIGGGPAGLAAAWQGYQDGLRRILIIERDVELGGILNQCIHNGFGLHYFKEELTGPEYAGRFIEMLKKTCIEVKLNTMVLDLTAERKVSIVSSNGYQVIQAKAIILAMGCRERTSGAVGIPGTRPSGVFTAGAAQRYINMEGYMVGKRILILGSGDIGLIMARRLTLEGAKVIACIEVMPYSGGLNRNLVQCLNDYDIPLYLSHTIIEIRGERRVEGAVVARVDEHRQPIAGSEMIFECDTILLSVGLIPENELSRQAGIAIDPRTKGANVYENMETSISGIFACGNVVHVHDLVDFVTAESQRAGTAAAQFAKGNSKDESHLLEVRTGQGISYTVPQKIRVKKVMDNAELFFRVNRVYGRSTIIVSAGDVVLAKFKRQYLAPGEMEKISLSRQQLELTEGDQITVSIEESEK